MRYLGKNSMASFLKVMLNIAWILMIIANSIMIIGFFLILLFPDLIPPNFYGKFHLKAYGLIITLQEQFIPSDPRSSILIGIGLTVPLVGIALVIIYLLRKIFSSLTDYEPFTRENAIRIHWIGIIIIAGTFLHSINEYVIGNYIANNLNIHGVIIKAKFGLNFAIIFLGLVVLILGELFNFAAKLKEDQDLTI